MGNVLFQSADNLSKIVNGWDVKNYLLIRIFYKVNNIHLEMCKIPFEAYNPRSVSL